MNTKEIFKTRTRHGPVWINQQQDILQLKFDKLATQSEINASEPHQLRMNNLQYLMGILLFIEAPRNLLLLGVGGGSLIHFVRHYLPETHITGVEYDAELLQIAQDHLLLPPAGSFIDYQIADAREYIQHCRESYDLIIVDIFDAFRSPSWLLQNDTIKRLKGLLSPRGAIGYNLLINSDKDFKDFYQQLRNRYQRQALVMETQDYQNILFYALNFIAQKKSITEYMQLGLQLHETYPLPFNEVMSTIYSMNPTDSGLL
jgi:spermidine synthase